MHVSIAVRSLRGPATTRTFLKAPSLSTVLRTCQSPRRHPHTSAASPPHSNVPPPLAGTPLRRCAAHHKCSPRRAPKLSAASSSAAVAPSWIDVLALPTAGAAPSRIALGEAAALCLSMESPKCYAVYRPCDGGEGSAPHARVAPHHFVELLAQMRHAPSLSLEARRVAEVMVDLLNKPPHPQFPGPWDISRPEVRELKASAIAYVMECVAAGDDALVWLAGLLGLTDTFGEGETAPASTRSTPVALLATAVKERLEWRDAVATQRVCLEDADGDWLLSSSPIVMGAIAAAMLRSTTDGAKASALELLEAAALSRLTRRSSVGAHPAATETGKAAVLFNEAVAVHCAEVAAVRGDVETVTRLIFLLYRARGALGCATLAEHRRQQRAQRRWGVAALLPRTPVWMRAAWWSGDAPLTSMDGDAADVRFEQTVVRLLRSVMHAALYHPPRSGDPVDGSVAEALSLWDGLRGGTSWPGLAAMATEMLTYLVDQHRLLRTVGGERDNGASADARLQQAGLRVYTQLRRAAPAAPCHRTDAQQEVLHHCVALVMQLFSIRTVVHLEKSDVVVPIVPTSAAAEHVLRLFAHAKGSSQGEALLPYALAASLTLLSAATLKAYRPPAALFGDLARYFAEVQSLHYYCVASGETAPALPHIAVCGSFILLHVVLLSHAPLGAWAREDGDLWSFVQRLRSLDSVEDGSRSSGNVPQHSNESRAPLLAWLRVSNCQQRQLLWSLLTSLKQREMSWCAAALNLFASPACSTAVFTAADTAICNCSLPQPELRTVMDLLYECGNTDDPAQASATLDRVVSTCARMPVRTLALTALVDQLQRKSASGASAAVLVVTDASLRAITQRCCCADGAIAADPMAAYVHLFEPLLRTTAARPAPSAVFFVLTPACLMELQRLRAHDSTSVVETLHAALSGTPPHGLYHVAVASAWPLLPSLATALRRHGGLRAVDGLRETTAAARYLEQAFPKETRPAVCLWTEEADEAPPSTPNPLCAVQVSLLQHYGAREVSTYRAHMEKAKSDIFSLLCSSSLTSSRASDLHVFAEVASTESSAARRVRNETLLSAVSQRRKGQRTL